MKSFKTFAFALLLTGIVVTAQAGDEKKAGKPKPYLLKTCPVTDEKLGEMGDPYVFTHEGREIKLCCKSCLKDFKKNPAKYVKKIETEEKKDKKS